MEHNDDGGGLSKAGVVVKRVANPFTCCNYSG